MYLRQHVDQVVIEDGRAVGVKLGKSGRVVRAKNVISNATVWDTFGKLVAPEAVPSDFRKAKVEAPMTESFMHLHLGIDATGLPDDLPMHHLSIEVCNTATHCMKDVCRIRMAVHRRRKGGTLDPPPPPPPPTTKALCQPPHPPSRPKGPSWEKRKFTVGNIWSGQFLIQILGSQTPPPLSSRKISPKPKAPPLF